MKILFLTRENYPTFRADIAVLFGKYLPKEGIQSDIVARTTQADTPPWAAGKALAHFGARPLSRLCAYLFAPISLFKLASKTEYTLIQVRDRSLATIPAVLAARWNKKPFVYWMSYPFAEYWRRLAASEEASSLSWPKRVFYSVRGYVSLLTLRHWILPNADFIFVQSDAMRKYLAAYGYPEQKMLAVPMGIDGEAHFENALERIPQLSGKQVLLYIGALERNRHPEIMLDALQLLRKEFPNLCLLLVGASQNAAENEWLLQEIQQRNLQAHIHQTGWIAADKVPEYAAMADIALSPCPRSFTLDMGSPTKAGEYMKYRLPMVVTDNPDQAALVAVCQAGLCTPFEATAFASAIATLLRDPALAQQYAQQGHAAIIAQRGYASLAGSVASEYRKLVQ